MDRLAREREGQPSGSAAEDIEVEALAREKAGQSEQYIPVRVVEQYRRALREYLDAGKTFDEADAQAMQDIWDVSFLRDPDSNILDILE